MDCIKVNKPIRIENMKKFLYGMMFHFFLFVVLREKQLTNVQRQTMPSHNTILNISLN